MSGVLFVVTIPKTDGEGKKRKFSDAKLVDRDDPPRQSDVAAAAKRSNSNASFINCDRRVHHASSVDNFVVDEETASVCSTTESNAKIANGLGSMQIVDDAKDAPVDEVLKALLKVLNINDAAWSDSLENSFHQITFSVSGRLNSERVLRILKNAGFGVKSNTSLSVVPCSLHYRSPTSNGQSQIDGQTEDYDAVKQSAWTAFLQSVRARQTVAHVVEQIKSEAALTFDFIFLLVVAAVVAALGLVENSTVFLVASMLISPLMGPIMASTFGTAIRDKELLKMGVKHELLGLLMALVIGFLFGLIICGIDESYGVGEWPTDEITSRCDLRSLWIGALIAIPSGAAVAIAILADNVASLVGVAISASLLPPAVNAGLLWAMSLIHLVFINDKTRFTTVVKTQTYSDNQAIELAVNGFISLCLTLVNIICIYIAGMLVYKIKEVAPTTSEGEEFWKYGIKALRDYNKCPPDDNIGINPSLQDSSEEEYEGAIDNRFNSQIDHRSLYSRLYSLENHHSTWSPKIFSRRVSAREIHNYYRQFSNENARRHRLSVPNNQLPGFNRINEHQNYSKISRTTEELTQNNFASDSRQSKFTILPVYEKPTKQSV